MLSPALRDAPRDDLEVAALHSGLVICPSFARIPRQKLILTSKLPPKLCRYVTHFNGACYSCWQPRGGRYEFARAQGARQPYDLPVISAARISFIHDASICRGQSFSSLERQPRFGSTEGI